MVFSCAMPMGSRQIRDDKNKIINPLISGTYG